MTDQELIAELHSLSPVEGLMLVSSVFGSKAKASTAFGKEGQLLTYWISKYDLPIEIFTIDTGRLFQESYDLMETTRTTFKQPIRTFYPDTAQIENLVSKKGPNSFYESVENRKECCFIRKVLPLRRALADAHVWITGVRSAHSANRQNMELATWDKNHRLIKYNPLLHFSNDEIDELIELHHIPVNILHNKGYSSIGCAPCTRATLPGEDSRAGRWWWETSAKECGLHQTVK